MIRQDIILNDYKYIVDLYKANDDIKNNVYSNFVMFRRVNVTNTISYDTDIYIIEKSVLKDVFENHIIDKSKCSFSQICFPMPNWNLTQFSSSIKDLNKDIFIKDDDTFDDFINRHGYKFYNKNGYETALLCDKIRIYHPSIVRTLKYIIYINNYINDINFHFYCRCSDSLSTNSSEDFSIDNFKYSEYSEFLIPNLEYLFSTNLRNTENKNVYFKENLSIVSEYDYGDNNIVTSKDYKSLIPLSLLTEPFEIGKTTVTHNGESFELYQKRYIYVRKSIENNYLTYSLNIYLYPYNVINSNNVYELTDGFLANGDTFVSECKFKLGAKLGFDDNGVISILGNFTYPNMTEFESIYGKQGLNKAYQLYNNITYNDYKNWSFEDYDYENIDTTDGYDLLNYEFGIKEITDIVYNGNYPKLYKVRLYNYTLKQMVIPRNSLKLLPLNTILSYKGSNASINLYIIKEQLLSTNEYIIEPYNITTTVRLKTMDESTSFKLNLYNSYSISHALTNDIYLIGYKIILASDDKFKNIIYTLKVEDTFDNYENERDIISSFAFNLSGLFSSWDEMPDMLIAKVEFIDRLLGIEISSNFVPITKEWFKYMINDIDKHYINLSKYKHTLTDMNIDSSHVNFIDKINCTINKTSDNATENISSVNYANAAPKILYKPMFYKAQTLNAVKIKSGITQNIGINLNNYLTKVETFKLIIDGNLYVETGRNDIYAIFRVNPLDFENTSGSFIIANQDDEYISDGQYIVY